jgi:hypothetical protein
VAFLQCLTQKRWHTIARYSVLSCLMTSFKKTSCYVMHLHHVEALWVGMWGRPR